MSVHQGLGRLHVWGGHGQAGHGQHQPLDCRPHLQPAGSPPGRPDPHLQLLPGGCCPAHVLGQKNLSLNWIKLINNICYLHRFWYQELWSCFSWDKLSRLTRCSKLSSLQRGWLNVFLFLLSSNVVIKVCLPRMWRSAGRSLLWLEELLRSPGARGWPGPRPPLHDCPRTCKRHLGILQEPGNTAVTSGYCSHQVTPPLEWSSQYRASHISISSSF